MGLFRRREPLHVQLAREGGLIEQPVAVPPPLWQEPGITGLWRPRASDTVATVEAPDIEGDAVRFVALPDGTLLVEEGGDSPLEPLAAAVEEKLPAPYRARAVRRGEALWAVEAMRIEVLALPDAPAGDTIDVTRTSDGTTVAVEGEQIFGSLPALEQRGEQEGSEYTVHAERLDGDLWEIKASAL
jgi:hypothetical protein